MRWREGERFEYLYPTHSAKNAEWMGHPAAWMGTGRNGNCGLFHSLRPVGMTQLSEPLA